MHAQIDWFWHLLFPRWVCWRRVSQSRIRSLVSPTQTQPLAALVTVKQVCKYIFHWISIFVAPLHVLVKWHARARSTPTRMHADSRRSQSQAQIFFYLLYTIKLIDRIYTLADLPRSIHTVLDNKENTRTRDCDRDRQNTHSLCSLNISTTSPRPPTKQTYNILHI